MTIVGVDLFCGAGGLTNGLQNAGIDVTAGFDIEPTCKFPYVENNPEVEFEEADLSDVSSQTIRDYLTKSDAEYTLVAGCAPCQPYSDMSNSNESRQENHEKWGLMAEFGNIVEDIEPDLVTMENVPQVRKYEPYEDFRRLLEEVGYTIHDEVVYAPEYGVPQKRKRLVLIASKLGHIELCSPTHSAENVTVRSEFGKYNLPALVPGETCPNDSLHRAPGLSETNKERIRNSNPGGTWKDWPRELRAECHKRESGRKYTSSYGRMEWDKPAPTITTRFYNYGSGRFGHPEEDRAISYREGAILQTFPKGYLFEDEDTELSRKSLGKLIGNAVPVRLAEAIGKTLVRHVNGEAPQKRLEAT